MTNKRFTVIGYYPDNDQPYAAHFHGHSIEEAIDCWRGKVSAPIRIVAVLHGFITPVDRFNETVEIYPEEDDDYPRQAQNEERFSDEPQDH